MKELEKPKLEFSIIDKCGTIFGIISSIFLNYIFDIKVAILALLIIVLLILIYSLYRFKKSVDLCV